MFPDILFPTPNWQALIERQNPIILDIGCNDGGHSRIFQHLFPNAMVYAFEPDPRAIDHCKQRIDIGQIDANRFELFEGVLSNTNGVIDFWPSGGQVQDAQWYETGWDLSGSTLRPVSTCHPFVDGIVFGDPVQVRSIQLDEWMKSKAIEAIDLLWMDVQGAELNVLNGAINSLEKVRHIYLECESEIVYEGQPTLTELTDLLGLHRFTKVVSYSDGNHLYSRIL